MQIHEVVNDTTLQVVRNPVDDDLLADIHDFQIRKVIFIAVFVDRLIHLFVHADAISEILRSSLGVLALVVGTRRLYIADVGHDESLIVAFALHKQHLNSFLVARVQNPSPALLGGIGCVENADYTTLPEPREHVGNGGLSGGSALFFAFGVRSVEKVGRRVRGIIAPVVTDIKGLCRN
jgi:hypothetical protein